MKNKKLITKEDMLSTLNVLSTTRSFVSDIMDDIILVMKRTTNINTRDLEQRTANALAKKYNINFLNPDKKHLAGDYIEYTTSIPGFEKKVVVCETDGESKKSLLLKIAIGIPDKLYYKEYINILFDMYGVNDEIYVV